MLNETEPCELCGKRDRLSDVIIEGAMLSVCSRCGEFGTGVVVPKEREIPPARVQRRVKIEPEIEMINPDYFSIIKEAREKIDLKQEELAKGISEKESVIHSLESGRLKPTIVLARKLEKFLNIKLVINYRETGKKPLDFYDSSLTIGDLIKMKK